MGHNLISTPMNDFGRTLRESEITKRGFEGSEQLRSRRGLLGGTLDIVDSGPTDKTWRGPVDE